MKNLILILNVLILAACSSGGGGGSNGDDGLPDDLPPSCKTLYDVWDSATDAESHDFSALLGGAIVSEYEYAGFDGATCGYVSNPNHNLSARIQTAAELGVVNAPFEWRLRMNYSLEIGGSCETYKNGANHNAYIVMSDCDELQICEDYDANGLIGCKTFN